MSTHQLSPFEYKSFYPARAGKLLQTISLLIFTAVACVSSTTINTARADDPLRTLDSHCPFTPPASLEEWKARAEQVRLQLRVSVGMLPQPQLNPVSPKIYGKREMDGYTVESCTFETLPGFLVTGTLYRPSSIQAGKKVPGILCPHGHWANGRFYEANDVLQQLANGAERFEAAAINPLQARCVQLARMGCVVYMYDMIGYADSQQISQARAHGFASQPAESEVQQDGWLLFSPLAESNLQSIMGLQTLASFRSVDLMLTLPEVDPARIGITGASGGGTQSFLAAALDPRIAVAFPAVMVSTGMQGGCVCENCPLLRTGTGNVEIAALFAPKPLGMTAADDWTRTMPTDGYPQLQKIYEMYGAKDKVGLFPALHYGHNYNHVSRVAMYGWINDHFGLGYKKPILETEFKRLTPKEQTVFDADHPKPEGGEAFERKLMKQWADIVNAQMKGQLQGDKQQNAQLAQTLKDGWRVVLGLTTGTAKQTQAATLADGAGNDTAITIKVGDKVMNYQPKDDEQPLVQYKRLAASYTYGYNLSQFTRQAQQLAVAVLKHSESNKSAKIEISGKGASAALAAAAQFCAEQMATDAKQAAPNIELKLAGSDFRFSSIKSIKDGNLLPGATRYWDLPGLTACLSHAPVIAGGEATAEYDKLAVLRK
ncbi:MAG: acetylxylan esterase [Pirellulales bacterium]